MKKKAEILEDYNKLNEEYDVLKDKYYRLYAEYDNYKKRTLKEKEDLKKYSDEKLLKDLIPFFEDLERGINEIKDEEYTAEVQAIFDGIKLVKGNVDKTLNNHEITIINPVGEKFSDNECEAVMMIPTENNAVKDTVARVFEKGYRLKDKVIKYAKVGVYGN